MAEAVLRRGSRQSFSNCALDSVWMTTDGPTVTHRQLHVCPITTTPTETHTHTHTHTHIMNNVTAVMEYIVISSDKLTHLIAKCK